MLFTTQCSMRLGPWLPSAHTSPSLGHGGHPELRMVSAAGERRAWRWGTGRRWLSPKENTHNCPHLFCLNILLAGAQFHDFNYLQERLQNTVFILFQDPWFWLKYLAPWKKWRNASKLHHSLLHQQFMLVTDPVHKQSILRGC